MAIYTGELLLLLEETVEDCNSIILLGWWPPSSLILKTVCLLLNPQLYCYCSGHYFVAVVVRTGLFFCMLEIKWIKIATE